MDLAHRYAIDVVGQDIPSAPAAKDVWNKTTTGYEKIKNTPDGLPQKGDIVIWGTEIGPYGHIAVFIEGNLNTFTSFDQNFPIGSLCHKQSHSYKGVLGWLHAKTAVVDAVSVPKADFERMLTKSNQWDQVCFRFAIDNTDKTGAKILIGQFEKLQGQLSSLTKSQAIVEEERETFREERNKALSNVCFNPSDHLSSNSGNSTGSDISSVILDNGNSSLPSDTPPSKQKNAFEKLIAILLDWFK